MIKKKDPTNEQLRISRLNRAYKAVLGTDGNRNSAQEIVLADMLARSYMERALFPRTPPSNTIDPVAGYIAEGMRLFHLTTLARLRAPGVEIETKQENDND